eukprot:1138344-Pelagomonas_calceolata.AAC.4
MHALNISGVQERRRIAAILRQPPNRPLHAEERAILWRFRFSLQQETRALTKFLQCVDWGDATEGRQVGVRVWVDIGVQKYRVALGVYLAPDY